MMMAVSFERHGRLYYLDPGPYSPAIGDKVLVPTDSGPEVAECVWAPQWISEDVDGLPVCAGLASEEDLARDEASRQRRAEGRLAAKRLIRAHGLPMKLVAVDYVPTTNVFTVYFGAPHRVDFRALVRDLAGTLRARVELRQVGSRDEARLQGGIGPCGRDLCCATFLKDFEPVSVRMAKDQNLPVNPMRIAGACGRLMCCLKYEHPLYQDFRAKAPRTGEQVDTPEGPGTVVGHNVPGDSVVVKLAADGRACACPRASVCGSRQAYEATHGAGRPLRAAGQGGLDNYGLLAKTPLQSYLGNMAAEDKAGGPGTAPGGQSTGAGEVAAGRGGQDGVPGRTVTRLTDPRALRAYAHPVRMKLVGLLRTEGPLTATRAAELLGESSGTCSFHLRQLAKYGLVEEAGGGTGREKPWRATSMVTAWDAIAETPEAAAATGLLKTVVAEAYSGVST